MNIIELVRDILLEFPKIDELHIDYTDEFDNYGLSSTGDTLVSEDILGNQIRKHNFILYAVYQSQSDYDRMTNSGVLLELQMWLEQHAKQQEITVNVSKQEITGYLTKLTCANGMLYNIPNGNLLDGICYQLQITAEYKIESEEI